MALQLADRVQQTGTANTTVSFTLSGSLSGYQSFSSAITTGNTLYYAATDGTNWEVGVGTLTNSTTLTRNNCLSSSNSNALVTAFSGTLSIWVDYPSSKAVYQDASNNVTLPAQLTAGNYVANETITGALSAGAFSYGTLGYTDVNIFESFTSSVNTYNQCIIQNTNNGNAASTDYVVSNNNGSSTAYYGDFGMNSSGWTGTAGTNSFNAPNMVYLTSTTGDLLLGTTTSNAIRFATNGGADAAQISSAGLFSTTSDATISTHTVGRGGGLISSNVVVGQGAFANNTAASSSVAIGQNTLYGIVSGSNNVGIGWRAMVGTTTATMNISNNIGIGVNALTNIVTGQQNVGVGCNTLQLLINSQNNTAIGHSALNQTTQNLVLGAIASGQITGGSGGTPGTYTAVPLTYKSGPSLGSSTYGQATIIVGAGGGVTSVTITASGSAIVDATVVLNAASGNIGGCSGFSFTLISGNLQSGSSLTAIGSGSGLYSTTATNNFYGGNSAGGLVTTGSNNVFLGANAGYSSVASTTGSQLVYIGSGAHGSAATNQNEIVIGYNAVGLGSNTTTIGVSGTTALTQVYGTLNTSGYTVSTLPTTAATGKVTGARTYVTDATTLSAGVFGGAVVGGGSVTIPVFYNGTTWIVG